MSVMTKLFSVSLLSALLFFLPFNTAKKDEGIKIIITNLHTNNGHVLISLFKNDDGFPDNPDKAIRKGRLVIKDKIAWVVFTGLPAGTYAAAILHDENDDQKMNKNFLGLPKEGYGFSNNAMGTFGPPSFNKASFTYSNNISTEISIKTKY
jgi:uncharacterized protein (DUF2141 family)